jgi:hypothetical protein
VASSALGHVVTGQQGRAHRQRPCRQVLGKLTTYGPLGDHSGGCDELLDLTSDIGRVPGGMVDGESVECAFGQGIAIQGADRDRVAGGAARFGDPESELDEFLDPTVAQFGSRDRDDLVGPGVGPGSPVPRLSEGGSRFLVGMVMTPLRLVVVDFPPRSVATGKLNAPAYPTSWVTSPVSGSRV